MSKFFTDSTEQHTFSLDHVVSVSKYHRILSVASNPTRPRKDYRDDIAGFEIRVVLSIGGKEHQLSIFFDRDSEEKRNEEYIRLSKALSDNS